jgi:hypothetical protein
MNKLLAAARRGSASARNRRITLAALCCASIALATPASGIAATQPTINPPDFPIGSQVPLKATARGQDTSESFGADGIHLTSLVEGDGTELGSFTQTLDYVISYDLVDFAGTGTITAADGSQLFLTFVGTEPGFAAQLFPTPFSGTLTISGGTGRFDAVGGQAAIAGTDFGQGQFAFSLNGTLSR